MKHLLIQTFTGLLVILTAGGCGNNKKQHNMEQHTDTAVEAKQAPAQQNGTSLVSKDGTRISYQKTGTGPAIIIVNGALSYRALYNDSALTAPLAKQFTVYTYDRRGRGASTETKPYAVDREIEDIEALINDAGGSARLFGSSSGAALSVLAAAKLGKEKIPQLVLYEPPYVAVSEKQKQDFIGIGKRIDELLANGKPGEAMAFHFTAIGTPADALEKIRQSPQWPLMASVEHTLAYDYTILDNGAVPAGEAKKATMPTLVLYGEKSFAMMSTAAKNLASAMPDAKAKALAGQTHQAAPEVLAPVLLEFFK